MVEIENPPHLRNPRRFEQLLQRLKIGLQWPVVQARRRLGWRVFTGGRSQEGRDELVAEANHAVAHEVTADHSLAEALLVRLVDDVAGADEIRAASLDEVAKPQLFDPAPVGRMLDAHRRRLS